jgi:predicted naringenin-chalcone synthase
MEIMNLPRHLNRTSVNFMGCYAAVHAMKLADAFCCQQENANVIIVCTELCTLHFQKEATADNITSSLLFGDGCAAMLVQHKDSHEKGIRIKSFFSDVSIKGKQDMAWQVSSKGFLMTLTGYVPGLVKEDFHSLTSNALRHAGIHTEEVTHWCIHPGGRKILEAISSSLEINREALQHSYDVLQDYGNMSSATILFVLKEIMDECAASQKPNPLIFGAAFGPGLTMETFTATYD